MNPEALEGMAKQKMAELRDAASGQPRVRSGRSWVPRQSLRVRTGWTLVHLGLRLVAEQTRQSVMAAPPAGS